MCRTASQAFMVVMAVVLVVCVGQSLAASPHTQAVDQQEVLLAITLNQMALLQEMNESSVCASREGELRELRLMKEATAEQLETMKETTTEQLEGMKETAMEQLEGMKRETREELQAVREMMEREMKEALEAIRNASLVQPSQPPPQQPAQPDLHAFHNDTSGYLSLCGSHKVLHGSRGSLSPNHPNVYGNGWFCRWHVILPEGTRPVFTWEYLVLEACGDCNCDWVMVWAPGVMELPKICRNSTTATHPMNSIMDNQFIVFFRSDGSAQNKGFLLHYAAELVTN